MRDTQDGFLRLCLQDRTYSQDRFSNDSDSKGNIAVVPSPEICVFNEPRTPVSRGLGRRAKTGGKMV